LAVALLIIFVPFLALYLGCVAYITRKMLLEDARQEVVQNAWLLWFVNRAAWSVFGSLG
jgi:hypothetical protein